jgi:hypothetical protein
MHARKQAKNKINSSILTGKPIEFGSVQNQPGKPHEGIGHIRQPSGCIEKYRIIACSRPDRSVKYND